MSDARRRSGSRPGGRTGRGGDWPGVRLHVVTGKGGTGKTTVAGAVALALASGGRRVLLTEVENRQGIAQLFDTPPLPYEERRVAVAPRGGDVYALAIDPEEALLEYLELFYNMRRAGRALKRLGAIDFATTIAPGMRDVLITGKVKEAVSRQVAGRPAYDAVVMDAPPTGRIARFLNVNEEVAGLARMGPVHGQANGVMSLLRSPRTAVHLVSVLEEMPVQETVDGVGELRAIDLPVGGIVVNMTREPLLPEDALAQARGGTLGGGDLAAEAAAVGLALRPTDVDALVEQTRDHALRVALESECRTALDALDRPTYRLPLLAHGVDLGGLYELANLLADQGLR